MGKDATTRFEQRVHQTIVRHGMIQPGDRVVVAVSGGADSLALLYVLHALQPSLGIELHVAHLNHGLRSEAEAEARFVEEVAAHLGLPYSLDRVDVWATKKETGLSLEHAARRERYRFFERVAMGIGARKIATAHTADDHVETVLIHLLRGAGTDGLGGIPPVRCLGDLPLFVIRPLMERWRHEVEAYCQARGLTPRTDSSNFNRAFLRNRVRLDLLPYLEEHATRQIKVHLQRLANIARPEVEFLEQTAQEALQRLAETTEEGLALPVDSLRQLHLAIQRRVVRAALRQVKGTPTEIGFHEVERVREAAAADRETSFDLPGSVRVQRRGSILRIFRVTLPYSTAFAEETLSVPGQAKAPGGGWICAETLDRPHGFEPPRVPRAREVFLDADQLGPVLHVRGWRPGDRFVPLGMEGSKSLHRLFIDEKIPRAKRAHVPIVADQSGIVWVAGVQIAERVKVTEHTLRLLRLRWLETGGPPE